jgi:signal transduction histidine kinase
MAVADSEARVTVKVADNGPGIPEADIEKVLEPFVRLERSRGRHTGGTGLGPGIARNIARVHGGDLVLENRLRGGLAATLTLLR